MQGLGNWSTNPEGPLHRRDLHHLKNPSNQINSVIRYVAQSWGQNKSGWYWSRVSDWVKRGKWDFPLMWYRERERVRERLLQWGLVCMPIWNFRFMWGSSSPHHLFHYPLASLCWMLMDTIICLLKIDWTPILKVVYIQKKAVFVHSKGSERSSSRILLSPRPLRLNQQLLPIPHPQ